MQMKKPIESFKKKTFISVQCAGCGEVFASGENEYDLFPTKKEAVEIIELSDWKVRNGKAYCEACK
jgi:hypothetical protein